MLGLLVQWLVWGKKFWNKVYIQVCFKKLVKELSRKMGIERRLLLNTDKFNSKMNILDQEILTFKDSWLFNKSGH